VANIRQLWRSSLFFRRVTVASAFALATLLVYFGSHIPRPIPLPAEDLNAKGIARIGEEQIVLRNPDIAEGDLALSYVGNKNEIADAWFENATLDVRSQHLLFPGSIAPEPTSISYTTGSSPNSRTKSDDTCHTTIEIRRARGSAFVEALKLYQSDETAGAQRFRQIVLDAGKTAMEIDVHTDSPTQGVTDLPGCHKVLTVGANKPVDLPLIPIRILVPSGKIDLHFNPANPSLPISTGSEQTFEAVSLGDNALRGRSLQVLSVGHSKGPPKLDVQAHPSENLISFRHLKLGSDALKLDIGANSEKAVAYEDGSSIYNYDLIAAIQKNPVLSFAFAAVLAPALWNWVRKNCFPNVKE
jgi:hypothetical protein